MPETRPISPTLPPLVSGALPLLGHAPGFLRDERRLLERSYAEHGEIFRLRLRRRPAIFMLGPDYARWVFKKTDDQNLAIGPSLAFTRRLFGPDFTSWPNRTSTSISARPCSRCSVPRWERPTWPSWSGIAPNS